jgi:hypothetical protein
MVGGIIPESASYWGERRARAGASAAASADGGEKAPVV